MTVQEALAREELDMGRPVELIDSAELAEGVLVLIYRLAPMESRWGRHQQVRTATYVNGVPKWSGIVSASSEMAL
jgi:hypothetical protein